MVGWGKGVLGWARDGLGVGEERDVGEMQGRDGVMGSLGSHSLGGQVVMTRSEESGYASG